MEYRVWEPGTGDGWASIMGGRSNKLDKVNEKH